MEKKFKISAFVKAQFNRNLSSVGLLAILLLISTHKIEAQSSNFTVSASTACAGSSVSFTGTTSCASITQSLNIGGTGTTSSSQVSTATNNITVEEWVKYDPHTSVGSQLLFYNGNSGGNGFGIYMQSSGLLQVLVGGKGWGNPNISLTPGIWQHVALVRNSGTWYFYLNGVQYSTNYTTSPNAPNGGTYIGCNINGGEIFHGAISQVAFWNTVRTASQIREDMEACSISGTGLAAYWSLNGTSSDLSGNGKNLSSSNTSYMTDAPPIPPTGGAQYVFDFGDGSSTYTSNVGSAIHTYSTTNNYTASLAVTYNGSTSTSTQSITVNPTPSASISGSSAACGSTTLTASGGTTYVWTSGSSLNTAATTISATSTPTVTVSNSYGCSSTASQSVTITANTVAGTISANQTITSPTGTGTSSIIVDQNLNGGGWYRVAPDFYPDPSDPFWFYPSDNEAQSFEASISALWTSIKINVQGINQPGDLTLEVFSGDGVNGTSLLSQTVNIFSTGINTLTFSSPISITAGQFYTFRLSSNGSADVYIDGTGTTSPLGTFYQNGNSSSGALYFENTYQINNANWDNLTLTGNTGNILYWQQAADAGFTNPTTIANTSATLYSGTIGNLSAATYFRAVVQNGSCDVLNTNVVTVALPSTSNTGSSSATACNSYTWSGSTYTTSGAYTKTFTNVASFDSVHTLTLTINTTPSTPTVNVVNNCNGTSTLSTTASGTLLWSTTATTSSINVSSAGTYTLTQTVNGCVSASGSGVAAPKTSNTGSSSATSCNTYTWSGSTYTTSGAYTKTLTNAAGCDSVHTLSLTINHSNTGSSSATACDTYTWSGSTYTTSGTYTKTFTNVAGCDSVHTLSLTINYSSSSSVTVSQLGCYTWALNAVTYTVSGNYSLTYTNAIGCDSIVTLYLTITPGVYLNAKAILSGPYVTAAALMHDSLRVNGLIPTTEPYTASPYNKTAVGGSSGETVSNAILNVTGSNAIVDWVLVELRNALTNSTVVANKRALIQRDGDIVSSTDGTSPVYFPTVANGNYYVSIKHRNHLGVMSLNAISFSGCSTSSIDFTTSNAVYTSPTANLPQRKQIGAVYTLWSGDANNNKNVKYNGLSNDKEGLIYAIGISTPNNTVSGVYRVEDVNMDGKIRYANTDNDKSVILNNVGVSTPNNLYFQHTPN